MFLKIKKTIFMAMKQTFWHQILEYLYLKKKDPKAPAGINLKMMHGMNRISIIMFLLGILLVLYKVFIKG
jgi:hypothetical protein